MAADQYPDATAHLHEELRLLDDRLRRRLRDDSRSAGTGDDTRSVTGDDSRSADSDRPEAQESPPADSETGTRDDTPRERIDARVSASHDAGVRLPLTDLVAEFDLSPTERDALVVAVAPAVDPDYGSLFAHLQDDRHSRRPTVGLVGDLLGESPRERLAVRALFDREEPLRATRLLRLGGDPDAPRVDRPIVADDRLADFLLGTDSLPASLADYCSVTRPTALIDDLPTDRETTEHIRVIAERVGPDADSTDSTPQPPTTDAVSARKVDTTLDADETTGFTATLPARAAVRPPLVHLHGPTGVGTERAVSAICAERGVDRLLRCDAGGLLSGVAATRDTDRAAAVTERLRLLIREARLRGCPIHLRRADLPFGDDADTGPETGPATDADDLAATVVGVLDRVPGPVFVTGSADLPASARVRPTTHTVVTVRFPASDYARRLRAWESVDLPASVDPSALAATFRLTPGGVDRAVALARTHETVAGGALTREAIYAGCRQVTSAALGSHATKVEPTFGWDDIVLPAEPARKLRAVADRIADEGRVYDDWGFADRYARGGGVAALFTGPSGTGKTMAAEVLARETGLDLYRIDLASVVSKYVGETESRLGEIFDGAAGSDAILLFDEADALFGKRSEVSDAHDRYANVETNYLLQRIESHDGTVVLTSNFPENIDDAFRRRLHLTVSFPRPDHEAREAIWRGVFPEEAPVADLDYDFLASFELTGGDVRNAALTAAFLAVSESDTAATATADRNGEHASDTGHVETSRVEMRHVVPAVRDELRKTGSLVDPAQFGDYWEVVNS
ncbi:ATP-binding protein [Salinirubrum litoreum]|uniref:ATP-binding protein n=1 Tax=Salinirubrum litoreum TaxID=1126234 RepID=A0ABD5RDW0_9EURY|nr:AAA family ATPase [Salinirubrum litoreum]